MLYQKLLLWDPSLESEEEETSELVAPDAWRPQDASG